MTKFFALSISDQIEWAIGDLGRDRPIGDGFIEVDFGDDPDPAKAYDLQEVLRSRLLALMQEHKTLFSGITAIGVSTIGVVNSRMGTLNRVALMRAWRRKADRTRKPASPFCIVDFVELFGEIMPSVIDIESSASQPLIVLNDAAARAAVELNQHVHNGIQSLFYVLLGSGVNGGIVTKSSPLRSHFAPEVGHLYPLMHPWDTENLTPQSQSGCPKHLFCYEGLVSGRRIQRSWDNSLKKVSTQSPAWDVISFYAAQFCLTGMLMFGPERIVVSVDLPAVKAGLLIDKIKDWMVRLNGGYVPEADNPTSIPLQVAKLAFRKSDLAAATYLARLAAMTNTPGRVGTA